MANRATVISVCVAFLAAGPALAQPGGDRILLKIEATEQASAFGLTWRASTPSLAIVSLSSELVTIAVVDGALSQDSIVAHAGQAIVTPIDKGRPQRFGFDARRLAATLPPDWANQTSALLERIAARQARQRFWGLIEPVNTNASAPVVPQFETVRASYLNNATIVAIRREAKEDAQALARLTAAAFAKAIAERDPEAVAALIDPKPFTDSNAIADDWQAARIGFANRLMRDAALVAALATVPMPVAADQTAFDAGGYRIKIVPRDRAMFVQSVEVL